MKLILTSSGIDIEKAEKELTRLTGKKIEKLSVVAVSVTDNPIKRFVYKRALKRAILELGISKERIKIAFVSKKLKYDDIKNYDVMLMSGGNTFDILKKIRKTGFDDTIRKYVASNKIYMGVSAGSMILGPDIKIAEISGHGDINSAGLDDLTGLNIVDFEVFPHYVPEDKKQLEKFRKDVDYKIYILKDGEALVVEGKELRKI